jgi:hypothetical protein
MAASVAPDDQAYPGPPLRSSAGRGRISLSKKFGLVTSRQFIKVYAEFSSISFRKIPVLASRWNSLGSVGRGWR